MKFALGLILGLLVASSYFLTQKKSVPENTKKEFQVFTEVEAKRFAEAPDAASKLKAAEELYGKMMILFLANLGLQLQKSQQVEVETALPEAVSVKEIAVTPRTECAPCSQSGTSAPKKEEKPDVKLTTPEKFRSAPYFSALDPQVSKLIGVFQGRLTNFAGSRKGKVDGVLIDVDLVAKEKQLDGSIQVILTDENNTPYSRNRGKGGNKSIRYNQKERMVYVEASPNSFFSFRLSEFSDSRVRGDYYEDNILVGRAVLLRQ
ncbi:MAG: hypothetical protein V4598_18940 [Bdellovibrionota bacterium]